MLFVVSEALQGIKSISDASRDMSLSLRYFGSPGAFTRQMTGPSRRIVLLGPDDLTRDMVTRLKNHADRSPFALIVAADRGAVSRTTEPELIEALLEFRNFGDTTLNEVVDTLRELGLHLGMRVPPAQPSRF